MRSEFPDWIVFVGPSLRPHDIERLGTDAQARGCVIQWKPPIRRDDLLTLSAEYPRTSQALILDGEFHQRLSVSVSEIREILHTSETTLHGASSMGALRAVECRTLGMIGHGWVYEQYLSGATESDGDVALLYDPFDFAPVTIPMINIRWLLSQHLTQGFIGAGLAAGAYASAHSMHYTDRTPEALAAMWSSDLSEQAARLLIPELGGRARERWDRKRLDALDAVNKLEAN